MISILLNDESMSLEKGSTVEALLKQLEMKNAERMAIAVNNEVISRTSWPQHELSDQDKVLLIAPIQGG